MNHRDILAELSIEFWKLHGASERILTELPVERAGKVAAQLRYSKGQLDRLLQDGGLRLVQFDGEPFTAELPVTAVNAADMDGTANPIIEKTLEPAVVAEGSIVRVGKVILRGA